MKNVPNFRRHLWIQRRWVFLSALLLIGQAGLVVLIPLPLKAVIDWVFDHHPPAFANGAYFGLQFTPSMLLVLLCGAIAALAIATAIGDFLEEWLLNAVSHFVMEGMRRELTESILSLPLALVERRRRIDYLGRLSSDIAGIDTLIISGLSIILRAIPILIMILISMSLANWEFSAALIVAVPLMGWLGYKYSARLKYEMRQLRYAQNDYEQDTVQALESIQLIKSFSIVRTVRDRLFVRIADIRRLTLISRVSQGSLVGSLTLSRNALRITVLLIGGFGVLNGRLSLGTLVEFLAYTESLSKPVGELSKFSSKWAKAVTSLERVEELYREFNVPVESGGKLNQLTSSYLLKFDKVDFHHQNGPALFKDFSVEFASGRINGVVGSSGSGKSSFVRLLNRIADPNSGEITLSGQNLVDYDLDYLRKIVTVAHQEPYFVYGSVRANLLMVLPDSSVGDNELWAALARVHAEEFVRDLPQGLDTIIGEGARQLSGGQKQRLNLARAFLRPESLIFIFDEATSGLDPASAAVVLQSVEDLRNRGALIFWITHRNDELKHCDDILKFKFGSNPVISAVT